jgi:uncharacterized membrane protein YedE/YeeE
MSIDFVNFTPLASLFGGLLLGISIITLHFFFKRIAGISGIINSLLTKNETNNYKFNSILFLLGLLLSPLIYGLFITPINVNIEKSYLLVILGGLLVGFGTTLASGCTSGHGVCGISRFSIRSVFATLCFMFSGIVTVFIFNHLL